MTRSDGHSKFGLMVRLFMSGLGRASMDDACTDDDLEASGPRTERASPPPPAPVLPFERPRR